MTCAATQNSSQPTGLLAIAEDLYRLFGERFELWMRDGPWVRLDWGAYFTVAPKKCEEVPPQFLDLIERDQVPRVQSASSEQHLVGLPVQVDASNGFLATAVVKTSDPRLLEKLALVFCREQTKKLRIERLSRDIEACSVQISNDFEELTLLSSFANRLYLADIDTDLPRMAKLVLPLLLRSVKAHGLIMILADRGLTEPAEEKCIVYGEMQASRDTCLELVAGFRADAAERPVVWNRFDDEQGAFPGVRDFVMVEISKANDVMGWLLAVNRVARNAPEVRYRSSHLEFGTAEASLMTSTASMLAAQASNVKQFREKEQLLVDVVRTLVNALDAKDGYTCGHSERVALFAACLGRALGLDEQQCDQLYLSALVHDIGKIGVRDTTLQKPGHLNEEEFAEMCRHPELGWGIMQGLGQPSYVLPGVVHHHERFDGKGYPDGLVGEEIPRDGRIIAIVDAYDAMTSDRPYREGKTQEEAEAILCEGAGKQWDATMVTVFLDIMPQILEIQHNYRMPTHPARQPAHAEEVGLPSDG